jgi:hypothetical protein
VSPDVALHSGVYSFTLNPAEGLMFCLLYCQLYCCELLAVSCSVWCLIAALLYCLLCCAQARFTFLYRKYNGHWLIAEHHSSAIALSNAFVLLYCLVYCYCAAAGSLHLPVPQVQRSLADRRAPLLSNAFVLPYSDCCTALCTAIVLPQARFTFLYRKYNGRWLIAEHHSSAMPEQKPAGVEEMFDKWNAALQVSSEQPTTHDMTTSVL